MTSSGHLCEKSGQGKLSPPGKSYCVKMGKSMGSFLKSGEDICPHPHPQSCGPRISTYACDPSQVQMLFKICNSNFNLKKFLNSIKELLYTAQPKWSTDIGQSYVQYDVFSQKILQASSPILIVCTVAYLSEGLVVDYSQNALVRVCKASLHFLK